MHSSPRDLTVLDRSESLTLLAGVPVGQVVFTHRALPDVLPVNFRLDGDSVVIRVAAESALARVADGTVLAFHADRIDEETHTGWSVNVLGRAAAVTDPEERNRVAELPLVSWAGDAREHFIRISAERVTGRRLG